MVWAGAKCVRFDTFDIACEDKRAQFVKVVTGTFPNVSADDLGKALMAQAMKVIAPQDDEGEESNNDLPVNPLDAMPKEVVNDALAMLQGPDLFDRILMDIENVGVVGEDDLKLMIYIIMTSRLMDKPLSAIVQGASSSGKSYTIETVAKMMPPEVVVQAHDFTDQALFYLPPHSLEHKVVVSGERVHDRRGKDGQAEDNSKAFREMVGSGVLRKAVTVKGPDGATTTVFVEQSGPIAFLESSTATQINDEDATRLLPLVTDESAEQTQKIVEATRQRAKGKVVGNAKRNEIIARHHAAQRLLKPTSVRIPYADCLSLPETNVATRRTYTQLLYAIGSIAFLRQFQKQVHTESDTGESFIMADEHDYALAHRLMRGVLLRKYSPIDSHSRDLLKTVISRTLLANADGTKRYGEFTIADAVEWTGVSEPTVRRRLKPLVAVGIIMEDSSGKPFRYRVVKADLAKAIDLQLPTPEDIAERIAIMEEHIPVSSDGS